MIIVTGAAGFIGSCLVRMLNENGYEDLILVDDIDHSERWKLLRNKRYTEYIHKSEFLHRLPEFSGQVTHVIHMGACSATTELDFDYLNRNNVQYTKALWEFCADEQISFLYASSAATYGDGAEGFSDREDINRLLPLNGYGYSKQMFDQWALKQEKRPKQWAGFKFFNVYGPNEYYKDDMASVIFKAFHEIKKTGEMKLFRSHRPDYVDGGQLRDFVYVKDICKVIEFFMANSQISGIFNLGTGKARSFADLVKATFVSMGLEPRISFIDMPVHLREKYQYFTEADMQKLRSAGYTAPFFSLEMGVQDYVQQYLMKGDLIY